MPRSIIESYYQAFRLGDAAAISSALSRLFTEEVTLDTPIIRERFGNRFTGMPAVLGLSVAAAPLLRDASIKAIYEQLGDPSGIAALIELSTPLGIVAQSDHFVVDLRSKRIASIQSNYDPRKLLT
ncbi:MAG: hypothetical protein ABI134_04580 [Byssovorax sp.]